jgi:hypothetical protein
VFGLTLYRQPHTTFPTMSTNITAGILANLSGTLRDQILPPRLTVQNVSPYSFTTPIVSTTAEQQQNKTASFKITPSIIFSGTSDMTSMISVVDSGAGVSALRVLPAPYPRTLYFTTFIMTSNNKTDQGTPPPTQWSNRAVYFSGLDDSLPPVIEIDHPSTPITWLSAGGNTTASGSIPIIQNHMVYFKQIVKDLYTPYTVKVYGAGGDPEAFTETIYEPGPVFMGGGIWYVLK